MWGIKAEGEATAGVVIASANQIHDCGRANEPGSGRIPSFERSLPGGGIVGVHIATGNYISTSSIKGTTAIKDTAVASGNDMRGFDGRLFANVSSSSGNFPKAPAGGYSRGVVDAANKETILAGRIGGSGGGRIVALANGAEGQLVTLIAREPTTLVHGHADTAGMLGQPILTRGGGDKPLAAYESVRLVLDGGSWREVAEGCLAALKTDETQAVDETVDEAQVVVLNQTTVFDWATMPLNLTKHGINKKTHLFCAPPPAGRCCRAFRRSCC